VSAERGQGLSGRTVVVTRAPGQAASLSALLEKAGARPLELPTISIEPPLSWAELDRALAAADSFELVVLGSVNAAEALADRADGLGVSFSCPVAVVGEKTRARLAESPELRAVLRGAVIVPGTFRAEVLLEALDAHFAPHGGLSGKRVLLPRAAEGRETLLEGLTARGAEVVAATAYRIAPALPAEEDELEALARADAFTFMSGETLAAFFQVVPEPVARRLLADAVVAVIGPVALARAEQLGVRVDVVPPTATAESLVEALSAELARRPPRRLAEPRES
jgi:uroporphyrinogen-III synthase